MWCQLLRYTQQQRGAAVNSRYSPSAFFSIPRRRTSHRPRRCGNVKVSLPSLTPSASIGMRAYSDSGVIERLCYLPRSGLQWVLIYSHRQFKPNRLAALPIEILLPRNRPHL